MLITGVWNGLRTASSITLAPALQRFATPPGPGYIGITGASVAVLSLVILWAFWRRKHWAPMALLLGAAGYAGWSWIDRLVFQYPLDTSWRFSLLITVVLLAYIAAVALDPRNRMYFGKEAHEREKQDRSTA